MKIGERIRERRTAKNMTQEQVANYLGVTAPAVNKWEKGSSYPDITLLPVLARLLDTDLNTLLSFQDDLSAQEVAQFINDLAELSEKGDAENVIEAAKAKINQFPTCAPLLLNVATFLEGQFVIKQKESLKKELHAYAESLYLRAIESGDESTKNHARAMLIYGYMREEKLEQAEELLRKLPDRSYFDKKQIQIQMQMKRGELDAAAKAAEEKLFAVTNDLYNSLLMLMDIAIKQERTEDAAYIADVSKEAARLFDLWEYHSYVAHFELYLETKQRMKALKIFGPMMKSLHKKWNLNESPLYRHIETKDQSDAFGEKLEKAILESVKADKETEFLWKDVES